MVAIPIKLDPDPFILLSLHAFISSLMLFDPTSTLAVMTAVGVSCFTLGSVDISSERAGVILATVVLSLLLGKIPASIAAISLAVFIIVTKMRPLRSAAVHTIVLLLLALTVFVNCNITATLSTILILVATAQYLLHRLEIKTESSWMTHLGEQGSVSNNNNNNNNSDRSNNNIHNRQMQLMNGERLPLSNVTESLDLHGHTVTSALKSLHQFLKEHEDSYRVSKAFTKRVLTVITGEDGKNHPEDQMNLIKPTVANFLKLNKYRFQSHPDKPGIIKIDLESHVK